VLPILVIKKSEKNTKKESKSQKIGFLLVPLPRGELR
jgi:hypothetical protein